MPTVEQHRAALAKAQAAGDAAAVAEIQQALSAAEQSAPKPYDSKVYQGALSKAWTAKDVPATVEIADDWMAAASAAGKRTPMQYSEDELRDKYNDAKKAGDNEGVILLSVAAKRKGVNLEDAGASFMRSLGRGADKVGAAVTSLPGAAVDVADKAGRGVARLAEDPSRLVTELPAAVADNALTMARSIPGAEYVEAGGGQIVNLLEGEGLTSGLVEEARAAQQEQAERNPVAALAGQVAGAGAVANRVAKIPGLAPVAGQPGNIAKTAAIGGVTEGAVGLADTGSLQEAAQRGAAGAVLTPIATAVVKKGFEIGAPAVRAVTGQALPSGMKKLSQIVKIPVRELEAARVTLKAARGGQNPSIAEIVDTATTQRAQSVVASQPVVAKAAQEAAEVAELARPTRAAEVVAAGGPTRSAKEVIAGRQAAATEETGAIRNRAAASIDQQTREARRTVQAQRAATERDVGEINRGADQARTAMQAEIRAAAEAGDLPAVERATALRDEWADNAMTQMERRPIPFTRDEVGQTLGLRPVRDILQQMARNAPDAIEIGRLERVLNAVEDGSIVSLTVRDIDSLRQGLRAAAEANPALRGGLNRVADRIIETARRSSPEYRAFLQMYGELSDELAGLTRGQQFVRGDVGFVQEAADATAPVRAGMGRGARIAVESAAGRSAEDAERLARELVTEGGSRNAQAAMGERGGRITGAARRGVEALDAAADAARARTVAGRDAVRGTREALSDNVRGTNRAAAEEAARVAQRLSAEKSSVTGASTITGGDTAAFRQAFDAAPATVQPDMSAVARSALRDELQNSFGRSSRAVEGLQAPGFQDRARTAFGEAEAARLAEFGRLEGRAGRNLDALNPAPNPRATMPRSNLETAIEGLSALGPSGMGHKANVFEKMLARLQGFGMSKKAAEGLSKALFDPAQSQRAVEVLQKIGKYQDIELLLATELAAGLQAGE